MLRPSYLQPGDKVALFSSGGHVTSEIIEKTEELLCNWELIPVRSTHLLARYGALAGTHEERLAEWQEALDSDDIRAIWCCTDGYGSLPLVENADYSTFQGNPKWLIGMDDATILHAKLNTLGVESIHSWMPVHINNIHPDAVAQLRNILFGRVSSFRLDAHLLNRIGYAEAEMNGGMLSCVQAIRETSIVEKNRHFILFIEDLEENIYTIEKNMLSLHYSGFFNQISGLIVGDFIGKNPEFKENAWKLIRNIIEPYAFPVCFGFPAGHVYDNFPFLLGSNVELTVSPENVVIRFT